DGQALTRAGAQAGDLIAVSGTLGASAAGLRLLTANGAAHGAATADFLIAAHLRPQPRLALGRLLVVHGATAAMDLSDGLFGDLPKLLGASGATGRIDARTIPVASSVRAHFPLDWLELATRGGEDYELLFTIPGPRWFALSRAASEIGATLTTIGAVTTPAPSTPLLTVVGLDGRTAPIDAQAFDHFGGEDSSSSA
ncbi:MAG: thiamine-phosphate kinase, partial [Chloroflexia bacterium]|nr:thiamine-phosphate kinase [Chloroflexia bacterium]